MNLKLSFAEVPHLDKFLIPRPPWTGLGKKLESLCRKAIFEFKLLDDVKHLAVALSGGKDSLTLLFLLCALRGRGIPFFSLDAIHVAGEFSCGSQIHLPFLSQICKELQVPLHVKISSQKRENLECYSCSRERRKLIFNTAKEVGATTIAFGHHREDLIQTLLMNLFHKAEFAANLPKIFLCDYGVTLIRPLTYASEREIKEFARQQGFARVVCQCPVGQNSMRQKTETLLRQIEKEFPNVRKNLFYAAKTYGSTKALRRIPNVYPNELKNW
jgi:tRNA 2-thiocytidine biosynthesis protein TtcA